MLKPIHQYARRQITENQNPHINKIMAKELEKSQEKYLKNVCILNYDTDLYLLAICNEIFSYVPAFCT